MTGPFVKVPQDMMSKAKLKAMDYSSSAEKLGERFHASPALLRSLNPGKRLDRAGEINPALFWDAKAAHKARIAPGPNNPVGVVWIDLSKEHYGIHGTPEPGQIGKTESHGCIRLTNWDAAELAGMVAPGVTAVLQE